MTSNGGSDFEIKFAGHIPMLWKRKVRNFIKQDRQHALEIFLNNFKQGKDVKQMHYGLAQLLPDSLHSILSCFEGSTQEEIVTLFELLSTPEFLTHFSSLNQEKQESILNQIYQNWKKDLKLDLIQKILSNLDPTLSTILYTEITESTSSQIVEIMKLWGTSILPFILELYVKTPITHVEPLFRELEPNQRVEVFQKTEFLSKAHLQNILQLMSPTEIDLYYLLASKYTKTVNSRKLIHDWLTTHKLSHKLLLNVYQQIKTEETLGFIIEYFMTCIKHNESPPEEIIISILRYNEFLIAHKLLRELNSKMKKEPLKILISSLKQLQGEVSDYTQFFQSELKIYSHQNLELITKTYLTSPYESHQQLLIPFLQDNALKEWKATIKYILETSTPPTPNLVFNIFTKCSKRIKHNIGTFLINESLVKDLNYLFSDFDIFQSALVYKKELSTSIQALLDPFLRQHVSERFEKIILLGKKITFPQLAFASIMDHTSLKLILTTIGKNSELIHFWEETFLLCPGESLQVGLEYFLIKERKKKDHLIPLLTKLIDFDPINFWTTLQNQDIQDFSTLEPILTHSFESSISIIGEILPRLPEDLLTFIIKQIIPKFSSSGSKILYSLFSVRDVSNIEKAIILTILETINLNPGDLLIISLIRCSKLITDPELSSFIPHLLDRLFSLYPTESLAITDTHKLVSLVPTVKSLLSSFSNSELVEILIPLMITLTSNILTSIMVNCFLQLSKEGKDLSLLEKLLSEYETREFSIEGKNVFRDYLSILVGKSESRDLLIFVTFQGKPRGQTQFLPVFFTRTSHRTIEKILLDSPIDSLEENMLKSITSHFESNPPQKPEEYFFSLYNKGNNDIQRAVLPLLGEFCSWRNLSKLMELQEKEKYHTEYHKALIKFSSRFDIQSPQALKQIWVSGLKDVYSGFKEPASQFQSQCPQCGNPILENQKNCGFCSQRLTCIICRKSVVQIQIKEEVVQCPQCSSFFHRRHLLESVKLQKYCPVCNVKMREAEVKSLPIYTFFYK